MDALAALLWLLTQLLLLASALYAAGYGRATPLGARAYGWPGGGSATRSSQSDRSRAASPSGLLLKAGSFPLHSWLAPVHGSAWTPVSAIHGALVVKASFYILLLLWRALLHEAIAGAWALGALGMIGMPPVVGFISKWMRGMGAVQAQMPWVIVVLVASTLVLFFAAQPGLSKGALFLGVGISEQPPRWPAWLLWTLLTLPALSLAGGLGTGLFSKWGAKTALETAGEKALTFWLSLAAVGTTPLMAGTLWRQWQQWHYRSQTRANQTDLNQRIRAAGIAERFLAPMPLAWLISVLAALSLPL